MAHLAAEAPPMKATFAPRAARGFLLALLHVTFCSMGRLRATICGAA
jgi:hypothetical protein